jgi:hypothetical protein
MGDIFREFGIDYYLVGALARDIRLSAHEDYTARRRTRILILPYCWMMKNSSMLLRKH